MITLQRIGSRRDNPILLGGDFNFAGWDWPKKSLKKDCPYANLHTKFANMIDDNGLMQIVEVPTRKNIILDLIITNRPNQINRTHTLRGIADHDIVYTKLDIKPVRRKQTPRQILQYNKADWQGFRQLILQTATKIAEFESHASTEELWKVLSDDLHKGTKTFIPHKTTKTRESPPWINKKLEKKTACRN